MNIQSILLVGIGGALGTLLRFSLFILIPIQSIWVTVICNIVGAFLLASLYTYLSNHHSKKESVNSKLTHDRAKLFFGVGLLGSFTTFSTISSDMYQIVVQKTPLFMFTFFLYMFVTFCGGLAASALGVYLTKKYA